MVYISLFHLYEEHVPRHSKVYTDLIPVMEDAYQRYRDDVREHAYPAPEHTVYMKEEELQAFASLVGWESILKLQDRSNCMTLKENSTIQNEITSQSKGQM